MSSDEDDYMSASFVVDSAAQDIRPGLILKRSQLREHEILKKKLKTDIANRNAHRPVKVVEAERREEGLQSAISSSNRGFALLQKMGYKPGSGIGKTGSGRVEPVPITLKSDRQGLGRSAALQELAERKRALREKKQKLATDETVTPEQFRARLTQQATQKFIEIDLRKSQKMCHQFDEEQDIDEPAEKWFWPLPPPKESSRNEYSEHDNRVGGSVENKEDYDDDDEEEEEEEDDEFEPLEKLEMLTKYLRTTYNYCIWCCIKFENREDMENTCPGPTRNDH